MNQILVINNTLRDKRQKIYFYMFFISVIIIFLTLFYFIYSFNIRLSQAQKTNLLKNKYTINSLYPQATSYTALKLSNNISIIGSIEIPLINISYPIIENTNEELLKFSVCRFSGPFPNRIGNLCLAGHNYKNNSMFSKLYKLELGDSIYITDLNNTKLEYIVYDKFKVKENNLDCTKNSNDVEITLITCNNVNNNERIVIKAKMKG